MVAGSLNIVFYFARLADRPRTEIVTTRLFGSCLWNEVLEARAQWERWWSEQVGSPCCCICLMDGERTMSWRLRHIDRANQPLSMPSKIPSNVCRKGHCKETDYPNDSHKNYAHRMCMSPEY